MSEFYVGQKVVYVGPGLRAHYNESVPIKNGCYTIRAIIIAPPNAGDLNPQPCLRLCEITNPIVKYGHPWGHWECAFAASHFRPLEAKSIQIFRDIAAGITPLIPDDKLDEVEQREIAAMFDAGGRPIW